MAKVFIEETTLTAIGDAIRSKTGKTELIDPAVMSTEIESISGGGLPPEAYIITGDCYGKFANDGWNWYLETFGDQITTKDISRAAGMFASSRELTTIPLEINLASYAGANDYAFNFREMFNGCTKLTNVPRINFPADIEDHTFTNHYGIEFSALFSSCSSLRDVENLFDAEKLADYMSRIRMGTEYGFDIQALFNSCASLRKIPTWFSALKLSPESVQPMYWYCSYNANFYGCYCLDEITNIPVRGRRDAVWGTDMAAYNGGYCENLFQQTFDSCQRVKNITFETQPDGTPYEANWSNQRIHLGYNIGWGYFNSLYNSGITKDKAVSDDTTYAALKNDSDWYTGFGSYSRYNHDSAVATINSLPDTSAFLAAVGGTNTITFMRIAGDKTDGGAIGNLTEAEIAVAAAKGWTVTLTN